jgi:hypothetical protein
MIGDQIWESRFIRTYQLSKSNCQNFAYLLYNCIKQDDTDGKDIPFDERSTWRTPPWRLTQVKIGLQVASLVVAFAGAELAVDEIIGDDEGDIVDAAGLGTIVSFVRGFGRSQRDRVWLRYMKKAKAADNKRAIT